MILVGNPAIDWHPFLWGRGKISFHFMLQKLACALAGGLMMGHLARISRDFTFYLMCIGTE